MKKFIKWALMPLFAVGAFTYHNLSYLCSQSQTFDATVKSIKSDCIEYVGECL